jgi:hypothetical protein
MEVSTITVNMPLPHACDGSRRHDGTAATLGLTLHDHHDLNAVLAGFIGRHGASPAAANDQYIGLICVHDSKRLRLKKSVLNELWGKKE